MKKSRKHWNSIMCVVGFTLILLGILSMIHILDTKTKIIAYAGVLAIGAIGLFAVKNKQSTKQICGVPVLQESKSGISINNNIDTISKADIAFAISELNKWKKDNGFEWYKEPDARLMVSFNSAKKDSIRVIKYIDDLPSNVPKVYEGVMKVIYGQDKNGNSVRNILIDDMNLGAVKNGVMSNIDQNFNGKHVRIEVLYNNIMDYELIGGDN